MGREAYLMRLAFGRSALDPPEDSETFTASRASEWSSALHAPGESEPEAAGEEEAAPSSETTPPPPHGAQLYDGRGHPINPWARRLARKLREAQNDILSVIGVTERKHPSTQSNVDAHLAALYADHVVEPDEDAIGRQVGIVADIDYQFLGWWVRALMGRMLVFPPTQDMPFNNVVQRHLHALGSTSFLFAGLPSYVIGDVFSPDLISSLLMRYVDREVWATISSRQTREAYDRYRWIFDAGLTTVLTIFMLPFRIHSVLQILGFAPRSFLLLPPPRSWLPFYGDSLVQWHADLKPLLPLVLLRPLESLIRSYLFKSCRPAIFGPRRLAITVNHRPAVPGESLPYQAPPLEETYLTPVFQRLFSFLNWARPPRTQKPMDPPSQPTLSRRETWPINQPSHSTGDGSGDDANTVAADAQQGTSEAEDPTEGNQSTTAPTTPRLHRVETEATLDGGSPTDHSSDSTVRVSAIGPNGDVNLEIELVVPGAPEQEDNEPNPGSTEGWPALQISSLSSQRMRDSAMDYYPHHVSELALEPAEFLASLANSWISGWLLMPLRVAVLRSLVRHVVAKPALYGVEPERAMVLPWLLGSNASVLDGGVGSFPVTGIKHVVIGSLIDVCMGLGYWLVEWSVVRYIGIHEFRWGQV